MEYKQDYLEFQNSDEENIPDHIPIQTSDDGCDASSVSCTNPNTEDGFDTIYGDIETANLTPKLSSSVKLPFAFGSNTQIVVGEAIPVYHVQASAYHGSMPCNCDAPSVIRPNVEVINRQLKSRNNLCVAMIIFTSIVIIVVVFVVAILCS